MFCKNCGHENPDNAAFCAACGTPMNTAKPEDTEDKTVQVNFNNVNPDESFSARPDINNTDNTGNNFTNDFKSFDEPVKKKKKRLVPAIIAIVLVLALAVGAIVWFWPYVVNTAMNLAEPQAHQAYVYRRSAQKLSDSYKNILKKANKYKNISYDGNLGVDLSDDAKELLTEFAGVNADLDMLDDLSFDYNYTAKDDYIGLDLTANASDYSFDAELRVDNQTNELTVNLPGISENALYVDLEEQPGMAESMDYSAIIYALMLPDEELADHIVEEYIDIIFTNIEHVERERAAFEAGGVTKKATCFTSVIDYDVFVDATVAVLESVSEDKMIEDHILTVFEDAVDDGNYELIAQLVGAEMDEETWEYEELDADEYYDIFLDNIDDAIDAIEDSDSDDTEIELKTYIDGKGDILAWDIFVDPDDSAKTEVNIFIGAARDGKDIGFELSVRVEDKYSYEDFFVIGKGEIKGKKFNGEIDISAVLGDDKETEIATIDCKDVDLLLLSDGIINGKFTFESEFIAKELAKNFDFGDETDQILSLFTVTIDSKSTEDKDDVTLSLGLGDGNLVSLHLTAKYADPKSIELHSDYTDDAEDWSGNFDTSEVEKFIEEFADIKTEKVENYS